jgi:hypothetical protein
VPNLDQTYIWPLNNIIKDLITTNFINLFIMSSAGTSSTSTDKQYEFNKCSHTTVKHPMSDDGEG